MPKNGGNYVFLGYWLTSLRHYIDAQAINFPYLYNQKKKKNQIVVFE